MQQELECFHGTKLVVKYYFLWQYVLQKQDWWRKLVSRVWSHIRQKLIWSPALVFQLYCLLFLSTRLLDWGIPVSIIFLVIMFYVISFHHRLGMIYLFWGELLNTYGWFFFLNNFFPTTYLRDSNFLSFGPTWCWSLFVFLFVSVHLVS